MSKSKEGQQKICSVWLDAEIDDDGTDKIKLFFCFNCRVPLIEYEGRVITIVPGNTPYTPSTLLQCKGSVKKRNGEWETCGMFYSFMGSIYTQLKETGNV